MQKISITPDEGNIALWLEDETDNIFTGEHIENEFLAMEFESIYLFVDNDYDSKIDITLLSNTEDYNFNSYFLIGEFELKLSSKNNIFVGWIEEPEPYGVFDVSNLTGSYNVEIYSNNPDKPKSFILKYNEDA